MLLPAARNNAVFHGELILRNAEPLRREIKQGLIGIGRRFTDIGRSAAEEIESAAAVWRAVGVAHDYRGDRLERRTQLFGNNLPVSGERGALAEIALARANQDRVIRMNLYP